MQTVVLHRNMEFKLFTSRHNASGTGVLYNIEQHCGAPALSFLRLLSCFLRIHSADHYVIIVIMEGCNIFLCIRG